MIYIITYDLKKEGRNYSGVIEVLKRYPHCKIMQSTWLIKSGSSADDIYISLIGQLDSNDVLWISQVCANNMYRLEKRALDFIKNG